MPTYPQSTSTLSWYTGSPTPVYYYSVRQQSVFALNAKDDELNVRGCGAGGGVTSDWLFEFVVVLSGTVADGDLPTIITNSTIYFMMSEKVAQGSDTLLSIKVMLKQEGQNTSCGLKYQASTTRKLGSYLNVVRIPRVFANEVGGTVPGSTDGGHSIQTASKFTLP